MRLENKVALISGAARGLGAAEAWLFAREGAKVVIGDVLEDEGKRTADEINDDGGECLFIKMDVTNEEDWLKAISELMTRFGRLDILVNNAGISITGPIKSFDAEDWDRISAVNNKGVFLGTKQAIPAMRQTGGGSIVNISSAAAIAPAPGNSAAYAATKGSIRTFSKATAVQYAKDNIRCNSVHPGTVATAMVNPAQAALIPMGRMGTPHEIAYGVLYLASDESSFVTGSELVIDGGRTAQ